LVAQHGDLRRREHQAQLQKIADNSTDPVWPGTRAAGTHGYERSVEYVAGLLREAGCRVTLDPVQWVAGGRPAAAARRYPVPTQGHFRI
jgi:hypothetical protein